MDRLIENTDFGFAAHLPTDEVVNSLAGALQAVVTLPPSPAASALARRTLAKVRRIQGATFLGAVTDYITREFHLRPDDLQSKSRQQHVAFCRQLAMFMCRKLTGASFPTIGEHFHRDHSTVIHAFNLIGRRVESDVPFRRTIERIERALAVWPSSANHSGDRLSAMVARKKPMDPDAEIMTVQELAKYLRVSISTIYRLAERHELPGFKVGDWRFHHESVDAWMVQQAKVSKTTIYPPRTKR
jgi:excisionase family DNA binding protein